VVETGWGGTRCVSSFGFRVPSARFQALGFGHLRHGRLEVRAWVFERPRLVPGLGFGVPGVGSGF